MKWNRQTETWTASMAIQNYDDTGIDTGSQHTKQIVAELIDPGGRIIHYEILELFGQGRKSLNSRKS